MIKPRAEKTFTGHHMLALMLTFFGIIIAVNTGMAVLASGSWTGLVVKNSYVASQQFNGHLAHAKRQRALGWTSSLRLDQGRLQFSVTDQNAQPIAFDQVAADIGRPAFEQLDQRVQLGDAASQSYQADVDLAPGIWMIKINAQYGSNHYRRDARMLVHENGTGVIQ